jgi:uracil-DNA glycosylase family 4
MPKSLFITLTKKEFEEVLKAAKIRDDSAIEEGRAQTFNAPENPEDRLEYHIEGCGGEKALGKAFGYDHRIKVRYGRECKDEGDVFTVEAKTTHHPTGKLLVHPSQCSGDKVFVLIRDHKRPQYEIVGWTTSWLLREYPPERMNPNRPKDYMMQGRDLFEIRSLIALVKRNLANNLPPLKGILMPPYTKAIVQARWEKHQRDWEYCTRCSLCKTRTKICLCRGKIPCDIFFCGEAPGESEDAIGQPFVGPAGKLLDHIVNRSGASKYRCLYANLVACFPAEAKDTDDHAPPKESILACAPRLAELIEIAQPKLIVYVGALPKKWLESGKIKVDKEIPRCQILHPASILRINIAMRELEIKRCAAAISSAIRMYITAQEV